MMINLYYMVVVRFQTKRPVAEEKILVDNRAVVFRFVSGALYWAVSREFQVPAIFQSTKAWRPLILQLRLLLNLTSLDSHYTHLFSA